MTASRVRIKALDYLIFSFALLIIALIAFQSYARGEGTPEVVISGADEKVGENIQRGFDRDSDCPLKRLPQSIDSRAGPVVQFTKGHVGIAAGLADVTRLNDVADDPAKAAQNGRLPQRRGQLGRRLNPIL